MAKLTTITTTPVTSGARTYPHVNEIGDFHIQQTTRLLWDRIHDLNDQITALTATQGKLVTSHNTAVTTLQTTQTQARQALAISQKVTFAASQAVGGSTGGSGSGSSGGTGSGSGSGGTGGGFPSSTVVIDGISVIINGGSPDVSGWQRTTHLDSFDSSIVYPTFSKQSGPGRWPDVPFGNTGGTLQYTLWVFEQLGGQWYASGIIEFWFGRTTGGANIACNNEMARNWTYDNRWGPMEKHQPQPGEIVGFMVTAGNQRGTDDHLVAERSNIVFIKFPTCGGITSFPPYDHET